MNMNRYRFWLIAIILTAFGLRLYNITYHSLWFDETVSVHWAKQTVPRILEVGFNMVEDRLPPLYYLTLKGWITLFGRSEFSIRLLSVFFGTLLIPTVATITARLFNQHTACYAALLIAVNPFLLWYAQEARMYAPAVLYSTLAIWAFLQVSESANQRVNDSLIRRLADSIPFVLAATAGLYSHLYAGFLLPGLGLWLVISYPRNWRLWLLFAAGGVLITLAFLPLAFAIWRFSGEATAGDPFSGVGERVWWLLQAFTVWKAPVSYRMGLVVPVTTAIFVFLAWLKPSQKTDVSRFANPLLLVSLLLISPFIIANMLLSRNYLAFFGERYFIIMIPYLLILAAVGADRLRGWSSRITPYLSHLPFLFLLAISAFPIPGLWTVPASKEAWRQTADYLADHSTTEQGILIHPDWVRYPFQFYFQGPAQTYAAFSDVTSQTALDAPLQGVVNTHSVIWLIQSHIDSPDPDRLVENWFASRYPLVTELYPPGVTLKGYATVYRFDTLPPEATPIDIQFENGMQLVGYQADSLTSATDNLFHPPSGWVHVTLYWRAARPVTESATPFVNLVGVEGVWGASLDRVGDTLKLYPPTQWEQGQIIRHDLDINLNPATPPNTYQLVVGLYGYETQYPLSTVEIK